MKSKYSTDDLYHLIVETIGDWDEWVGDTRARINLITSAIQKVQEIYHPILSEVFRRKVDYTGSSKKSSSNLYYHIEHFNTFSLDEFIESLMDSFQNKLDAEKPHDRQLYGEVNRIKAKYE